MNELKDLKIVHAPILCITSIFNKMGLFLDIKLPNSEKLYDRGFIPSGLALTEFKLKKYH